MKNHGEIRRKYAGEANKSLTNELANVKQDLIQLVSLKESSLNSKMEHIRMDVVNSFRKTNENLHKEFEEIRAALGDQSEISIKLKLLEAQVAELQSKIDASFDQAKSTVTQNMKEFESEITEEMNLKKAKVKQDAEELKRKSEKALTVIGNQMDQLEAALDLNRETRPEVK